MKNPAIKSFKEFSNNQRAMKILLEQSELEEKVFGQLYLIEIKPGASVGNHYHEQREEWLIPLKGNGKIILENILNKERKTIPLNEGKDYARVIIPQYFAHVVLNNSNSALLIMEYSTKPFDQNKEDKILYEVKLE